MHQLKDMQATEALVFCIFCKQDSSDSKSIEHIIPESLGNSKLTLPKGVVCDNCNNYFATHLEQPILQSEEFNYLRFNQWLKNKRGKGPIANVFLGEHVVKARREGWLEFSFDSNDFRKLETYLSSNNETKMIIPISGSSASNHLISRWLAKMGLELLAHKWMSCAGWNRYILDHEGLEPIRKYARSPKPNEVWSFSKRKIYDQNHLAYMLNESVTQCIYECDILATGTIENSEFYFVIAIFGIEYAINLAGDSMDGYYFWLNKHNQESPLNIKVSNN